MIGLLAAMVTRAAASPAGAVPIDDYSIVDAYVEERLAGDAVPGAAYAVVSSDGVEHLAVWGVDGSGRPVDESTPFLWGSVSKPFTATAVMTLVEDGRIDLDAAAVDYVSEFRPGGEVGADRITVRQLLQHTSGLPQLSGVTDYFGRRDDPYDAALAELSSVDLASAEPGVAFEYSSANYLVLGAVVQAASGMPYEDYLRQAVLHPVGMDGAIATADEAASLPDGHAYVFGRPVAIKARFDETGPSYGYLGGTVIDLARFAQMQLNGGKIGGTRVLERESIALMHGTVGGVSETVSYGLGWRIGDGNADLGTTTIWHTGASPGYTAGLILLPEIDRAVVVMQNAYGFFHDGSLIATDHGAARLVAGGQPRPSQRGLVYPAALGALTALVIGSLAGLVVLLRRIRKKRWRQAPTWRVLVEAAFGIGPCLAVAYLTGVAIPSLAPNLTMLILWAPDAALLALALAISTLCLAVALAWSAASRLRHRESR